MSSLHTYKQASHPPEPASRPEEASESGPVPCWSTPERFLAACLVAAESPEGKSHRKQLGSISLKAFLRVCSEDAIAADRLTGRNVQTSHGTVARRLTAKGKPVSPSVAKRARQVMERLGLSITMVQGRHLSAVERKAAQKRHGGTQIAIASTRHLSVPRHLADSEERLAEKTDHLPFFKYLISLLNFRRAHQSKPDGLRAATPKPKTTKKTPRSPSPRPLPLQRLTASLAKRLPFLRSVRHLGSVCDALAEANIDTNVWTAATLIAELDSQRKDTGWDTPGSIQNPVGWFRWLLKGISPSVQERRRKKLQTETAEVARRRQSALDAASRLAEAKAARAQRKESAKAGVELVRAYLRRIKTGG